MKITTIKQPDQWLLDGINALLPQLSPNANPLTLGQLNRFVACTCNRLYVARKNGQLTGMLTLVIFPLSTGVRAWIEDLVVAETARGMGIGRQLVQRALAHARSRGADNVNLTSHQDRTAANALYRNMGFAIRETNAYTCNLNHSKDMNPSKEKKQ